MLMKISAIVPKFSGMTGKRACELNSPQQKQNQLLKCLLNFGPD